MWGWRAHAGRATRCSETSSAKASCLKSHLAEPVKKSPAKKTFLPGRDRTSQQAGGGSASGSVLRCQHAFGILVSALGTERSERVTAKWSVGV